MIAAIVLAAGRGTRLGSVKPLLLVGGKPALACVLDAARAGGISGLILVLRVGLADEVRGAVDLRGCVEVLNDEPDAGMARSLDLGLAAVPAGADGALILHADMPFLRPETVRAVAAAAAGGARIAAPVYRGRRGFPVFFRRSCFAGLRRSARGDVGGRGYLDAHRDWVETVDVDDPGCVYDIDRESDLAAWEGARECATNA